MLSPINVAKTIPGNIPKDPATRFCQNGVRIAPKYIVTTSPGRQLRMRKKKHRKMELSCCRSISLENRGYFCINFCIASIPASLPIQYGTVRIIRMPVKLIARAVHLEKRWPTAISKIMRGKNTVALFSAYNRRSTIAAHIGFCGVNSNTPCTENPLFLTTKASKKIKHIASTAYTKHFIFLFISLSPKQGCRDWQLR